MTRSSPLRTPDHCFDDLHGFPFAPRYCTVSDARHGPLRMHYVDEGPRDAPVALLLHGEPTWSYLYRKMILVISAAGFRAVAPDHIGFGRSDKLPRREDHSIQQFVDWMCGFIATLDLRRITLVCQDWGGPIGLRALGELTDRFDAVLASNTVLPNCEPPPRGVADWPGKQISSWVDTCRNATALPVSAIIAGTCVQRPSAEILRAYDAPFPDATYQAAPLQITCLIPIAEHMAGIPENRRAWSVLERFERPFLTAFSDSDPATKAWESIFRDRVPGAKDQPHCEIKNAGHFVQEEQGEALARVLVDFMRSTVLQ